MQTERPQSKVKERIASVIGNRHLASAICDSIAHALDCRFVHLKEGKTVWRVFRSSLDAAIRDIKKHPRGNLFCRLIEFGPHNPDEPKAETSDGKTVLSDPECVEAVEFIFSHMVNRFKGELAELLALEPCIELVERRKKAGIIPADVRLYWGDAVQERRLVRRSGQTHWGGFAKGADGLLARTASGAIDVCGIVEIKSMHRSQRKLLSQIDDHISRLNGGVRLSGAETGPDGTSVHPGVLRIIVVPSTWKLSREFHWDKGDHGGRKMVFPEPAEPPGAPPPQSLGNGVWKITLNWSQEALEQAAYEMTYGYMAEVGRHVFTGKPMPKGWDEFTPEEAGYNAIRMMLYYMPLRPLSARHERLAVKLYNVYGFGYPLGVDSKEMMWPQDLA
jgi:hypothetical protein